MEKLVKVAVDAMGGDHAPGEVVKGAVDLSLIHISEPTRP